MPLKRLPNAGWGSRDPGAFLNNGAGWREKIELRKKLGALIMVLAHGEVATTMSSFTNIDIRLL
jgi:hypothetical protein